MYLCVHSVTEGCCKDSGEEGECCKGHFLQTGNTVGLDNRVLMCTQYVVGKVWPMHCEIYVILYQSVHFKLEVFGDAM